MRLRWIGLLGAMLGALACLASSACPEKESRLFFSWISNRDGQFESILVLNNYGDEDLLVTLRAFRSESESETVERMVGAGKFLEEKASSLFPALGSGGGFSVLATAPGPALRGRWVTNSLRSGSGASPSQGVAIRVPPRADSLSERAGRDLHFGYLPLSDNLISAVVLANIGEAPTNIRLSFYDRDGNLVGNKVLTNLTPFLPFAEVANNLVPEGTGDVQMIATSSSEILAGVTFIFNETFKDTAIGNAVAIAAPPNQPQKLIYPWISNREGQFESILTAGNFGDQPVTVMLTARRNGATISEEKVTRTIPARGFLRELASSLFPELGGGAGYAVILESPVSTLAGQWVTNNLAAASGRSPSLGVAVRSPPMGDERVGKELLFGYLPVTAGLTSAPVLINIGDSATNISLNFLNADGASFLATTVNAVPPNLPIVIDPAFISASQGNLYLRAVSSSQPMTGVAFIFNETFKEPAIGNASAIDPNSSGGDVKPSSPLFSDVTTTHLTSSLLNQFNMDAKAGDLDGDGDLDLVVAGEFEFNLVLINNGAGRFVDEGTRRIPGLRHDSEDVGLGDFDRDGDLDIVIVSEDDQINELFINNGNGFFSDASGRLPVAGVSNAVLVADINNDGSPDILIGNNGPNAILINNGRGFFTDDSVRRLPFLNDITQDLELGDVDGDGDLDLLVGNENENRLLINNGSGFFTDDTGRRLVFRQDAEETREADFGDVDGDGDLDILFANVALFGFNANPANRLLINNGRGFFTDETFLRLPTDQDQSLDGDFVDVDGDCDLDIITANLDFSTNQIGPAPYRVYLNNGQGFFSDETALVFPPGVIGRGLDAEAADFNGDGLIDLYLSSRGGTDRLLLGVR